VGRGITTPSIAADRVRERRSGLAVGNLQKHVRVARLIERAVARQVAPSELSSDVLKRDGQTAGQQVESVLADGLFTPKAELVGVAPLRRSSHNHGPDRHGSS
jgi:hypothetical protein